MDNSAEARLGSWGVGEYVTMIVFCNMPNYQELKVLLVLRSRDVLYCTASQTRQGRAYLRTGSIADSVPKHFFAKQE